jgi:hypothetical protein
MILGVLKFCRFVTILACWKNSISNSIDGLGKATHCQFLSYRSIPLYSVEDDISSCLDPTLRLPIELLLSVVLGVGCLSLDFIGQLHDSVYFSLVCLGRTQLGLHWCATFVLFLGFALAP